MKSQQELHEPRLLCREMMPRREPIRRTLSEQYLLRFTSPTTAAVSQGSTPARMRAYPMDAGSIVLPLRRVEEWTQVHETVEVVVMHIRDEAVRAAAMDVIPDKQAALRPTTRLDDERVGAILNVIETEQTMGCPAGRIFMESMEHCLATLLLMRHAGEAFRKLRGGLSPTSKRRVLDLIEDRLSQPITLAELANAVGLSLSHFSSMFRVTMGISPHQYVLRQRVGRAKRLMQDPRIRAIDISAICGFTTPQHFSRVFRALTGCSPRQYRQEL